MARVDQQIEPSLDPWAAVEQFRSLARKAFGRSFKGLILYGSYARGEQDAGSDVDILVLFKDKAASRGYYAMFYAAEAVLLSKGLSFSRHSAVIAGFGHHFAQEGLLPSELHTNLRSAFGHRNLGDYSTDPFLGETAARILRDATAFVDSVRTYLRLLLEADE